MTVTVLGISGSGRKKSFNKALLANAQELAVPDLRIVVHEIDHLPMFIEEPAEKDMPSAVVAFKQAIEATDGMLVATPEHNQSIPALLKNAMDWATRPRARTSVLNKRPIGTFGASVGPGGSNCAQSHLRQVALAANMFVMGRPQLIIPRAGEKFDENGRLLDKAVAQELENFLVEFREFVRNHPVPGHASRAAETAVSA